MQDVCSPCSKTCLLYSNIKMLQKAVFVYKTHLNFLQRMIYLEQPPLPSTCFCLVHYSTVRSVHV